MKNIRTHLQALSVALLMFLLMSASGHSTETAGHPCDIPGAICEG